MSEWGLPAGAGNDGWAPEALIDAMVDGLYAVDRDRRIVAWNPAATRLTGYSAPSVIGRWCGDGLLNHVDEEGHGLCGDACPLLATLHDGTPQTRRVFVHHEDGHVLPVRVTAAPVRDASGTIIGAVETFLDDSSNVTVESRLAEAERAALTDPLTGLGNRRNADLALARRHADWLREGRAYGVLGIDVDRFKQINDEHGHPVGDAVLRTIAKSLEASVRQGDEVFRPGGDEFLVLTGPITPDDQHALAARMRTVVAAGRYPGDPPARATVSIGCAIVHEGEDAADVVRRADERVFEAKRSGRDAVVVDVPAPARPEVPLPAQV